MDTLGIARRYMPTIYNTIYNVIPFVIRGIIAAANINMYARQDGKNCFLFYYRKELGI